MRPPRAKRLRETATQCSPTHAPVLSPGLQYVRYVFPFSSLATDMNPVIGVIFAARHVLQLLQGNFLQPHCLFDLPARLAAFVLHCIFAYFRQHGAQMPERESKAPPVGLVAKRETTACGSGVLKDSKVGKAGERSSGEPANMRAPAAAKSTVAPLTNYLKKRTQADMSLLLPSKVIPTAETTGDMYRQHIDFEGEHRCDEYCG
ncbi:hypothetical protein NDU88_002281 [Pleurodeles waltl]|uniref:Uncharacterized protein n=1 Tax=Pleurodeles waltl TaxID=8319 RepID=A0AAV7KRQ1_PLEWA|nr:hypothetical protein NDU88_002281 [Pleurodeles waltl]